MSISAPTPDASSMCRRSEAIPSEISIIACTPSHPASAIPCDRSTHRDAKEVKALVNRLSRIEGQIRGIRKMVDEDAYCYDVLMQSAAVLSALKSFNRELLRSHMDHCVVRDIREGKPEVMDELMTILEKLM